MTEGKAMVKEIHELACAVRGLVSALMLDPHRAQARPDEVTDAVTRAKLLIEWRDENRVEE